MLLDSTGNSRRPVVPKCKLQKAIDLRGQEPYQYREKQKLIGNVSINSSMEIVFDLKVNVSKQDNPSLQKLPLLFLEGVTAKIIIYSKESCRFGIMHYHRNLNRNGFWKCLIETDLSPILNSADEEQHHLMVRMINHDEVSMLVDGHFVQTGIDREICPKGEIMKLWIDGLGFKVRGKICDLVIRAG